MTDFLSRLLPSEGNICLAELLPEGSKGTFRHFWFEEVASAQRWAEQLDAAGRTVFFAQASFSTTASRKGDNAQFLRNFFMDIDCGEGKPYASQREGLQALSRFCKTTLLPSPAIVSSGNGLYAHWILDTNLPAHLWRGVAELLQKLVQAVEPGLDADGLVADRARVLRPIGSHNRKKGCCKEVRLISDPGPVPPLGFIKALKLAAAKVKVVLPTPQATAVQNAAFLAGLEGDYQPSSARAISLKCGQVAAFEAARGDVPEPQWYNLIGLLRHTTEGQEVIHEWSQGHAEYSAAATEKKIEQHIASGAGPTTCTKLNADNPGLCAGCRYAERVKSPIVLGYAAPTALERRDDDPEPPQGFTIAETGIYYDDGGTPVHIYPYPLWIASINSDFFGESFTIKHRLPHDGWREVTVASNKVCEPKAFFSAMMDAHIGVVGKDNKGLFMVYIETFMAKLRKDQRLSKLSGQMGWVQEEDNLAFIHGAEIYRKDGSVHRVGYSASAPEFVRGIRPEGDYIQWVKNTQLLNQQGLEGLAFQFLCSAFGAPLVRFTGYEGAMLSVVGGSGLGKTLTGKWGISAWGDPKRLILNQDDTKNALIGRLGIYNTLPMYIDEVSNITPEALSDLAYKITQGRDKARMTRNAVEKSNLNFWNTLAVVSSNHSLVDKLGNLKGDPGAEINRIFEYEVVDGYTKAEGLAIFEGFDKSFGGVGKKYAQWLTENQEKHHDALAKIADVVARKAGSEPEERFWTMTGAVAIYGGLVARRLGLSHVDAEKLIPWVVETIKGMRQYKNTQEFDAVSFLGGLLDRHANGVVCVASWNPVDKFCQQGYREPHGRLVARIEVDKLTLWVSAEVIRQDLARIHVSPRKLAAMLTGIGLAETGSRISLGRGTVWEGVTQSCWKFDLGCPALGHKAMALVQTLKQGEARG